MLSNLFNWRLPSPFSESVDANTYRDYTARPLGIQASIVLLDQGTPLQHLTKNNMFTLIMFYQGMIFFVDKMLGNF